MSFNKPDYMIMVGPLTIHLSLIIRIWVLIAWQNSSGLVSWVISSWSATAFIFWKKVIFEVGQFLMTDYPSFGQILWVSKGLGFAGGDKYWGLLRLSPWQLSVIHSALVVKDNWVCYQEWHSQNNLGAEARCNSGLYHFWLPKVINRIQFQINILAQLKPFGLTWIHFQTDPHLVLEYDPSQFEFICELMLN